MVNGIGSSMAATQMQQMQKMARERPASGGEGIPQLPAGFQSILDGAMQPGTTMQDVHTRVQSGFADYQKTDEFRNLSDDVKSTLTDLVKNGPPQLPAGFDPSKLLGGMANDTAGSSGATTSSKTDVIQQLLDQLADRGSKTRAKVDEQTTSLFAS
jgi:hypothetical protein